MCGSCCECGACKAVRAIVAILLLLLTIAAFMGVWTTHMVGGVWVFGTNDASFAIVAAVLALGLFYKVAKKLCPCNSKACGVCPGCGHSPCTCK